MLYLNYYYFFSVSVIDVNIKKLSFYLNLDIVK